MEKLGQNLHLYLMDRDPNGRIKCTLANWTGVVFKIPRTELDKCKNRSDLKQSGVYFLFGISEDTGEKTVYIGQASSRKNGEGILNRLFEHRRNSENYWTEAIVFITSNNSFGPTEISYLENRFVNLASEVGRYSIKNSIEPTLGNITEEKESELEEFIDYAKLVMGVLGHKIFIPLTKPQKCDDDNSDSDQETVLYLKRKSKKSDRVIEAKCKQTAEGFVVLKGSTIEVIDSERIPASIKKRRQNADIDSNNILQKDELFNSPSYAAAFVIGGNVNGLKSWKTADGISLKELESKG